MFDNDCWGKIALILAKVSWHRINVNPLIQGQKVNNDWITHQQVSSLQKLQRHSMQILVGYIKNGIPAMDYDAPQYV
jgi:hypothetical protein